MFQRGQDSETSCFLTIDKDGINQHNKEFTEIKFHAKFDKLTLPTGEFPKLVFGGKAATRGK